MAYFSGSIRSEELKMETGLTAILPFDRPVDGLRNPCKVLYLLHGMSNNHTSWSRCTSVEQYARQYGVAIVMPEVQTSFYYDMHMGLKYFSYITKELPALCQQMFSVSGNREDNYIAGLSMGGYGALKCAFRHPEQYVACASFSGLCDISFIMEHMPVTEETRPMFEALLGPELKISKTDDLFQLAGELPSHPQIPTIFITCGKQDFLYPQNLKMRDHLARLNLPFQFHDWDGDHEWGFWDKSVQMALKHFFEN